MSSKSTKVTLLALTALFLLPLVLAWLMYSGLIEFHPAETSNHGNLVDPPVVARLPPDFEKSELQSHWVLVYPFSEPCEDQCRADLADLRQVRRSLGRDAERVRIVYLVGEGEKDRVARSTADIDVSALVLADASGMLATQLNRIGNGAFLIDPLGNVMMHYPAGSDPSGMRRDLEHLLRYAKTDPQ